MSSSISETKRDLETYQLKTLKQLLTQEKNLQEQITKLLEKRKKLEDELLALKENGEDKAQLETINGECEDQDKITASVRMQLKQHAEKINNYFELHADTILEEGWDILEKEQISKKPALFPNLKSSLQLLTEESQRLERKDILELITSLQDISQRKIIFQKLKHDYPKNNDPFFGLLLSFCHEYGLGTDINKKTAFELDTKLAQENFPLAQLSLANSYLDGTNPQGEVDSEKAMKLFLQAINQKKYYAPYMLFASRLINDDCIEKDLNLAIKLLEEAATAGFAYADAVLANFYCTQKESIGKEEHGKSMFFHAKRASEKNHPLGHYMLHLCYRLGYGVEENVAQSMGILRRSADMGYGYALWQLAIGYGNGGDLPQDPILALKFYSELLNSHANVVNHLKHFHKFILENEKNQTVLDEFHHLLNTFKRSHCLENPFASFNLGFCFQQGLGVTRDLKKAIECYQQAATLGLAEASNELGILCSSSEQTQLAPHQAVRFFQTAASDMHNNDERQHLLENYFPLQKTLEIILDELDVKPAHIISQMVANYAFDNKVRLFNYSKEINGFFVLYRNRFETEPRTDNNLTIIGELISDFAYALEESKDDKDQNKSNGPST